MNSQIKQRAPTYITHRIAIERLSNYSKCTEKMNSALAYVTTEVSTMQFGSDKSETVAITSKALARTKRDRLSATCETRYRI